MGNINVKGGNQPEKRITWKDGVKKVVTDGGSRTDKFYGGKGKPDGPGHIHEWETRNKKGNVTGGGIGGWH